MVITVDGEDTDDPSYYEDFFISPGECLLGDVYVPKGGNEKDYQIVGPLDCGFTFESIKLLLVDGADFEFKFLYSTSTQQCGVTVPCSADDLVTTNLLEPRVSCLQPCVDGTCFFELGYINRFFTDIKTDGVSSFTDMGYKYHPPYSTESGVVNIFYPDSCANLKAREKFWDSDENTILFDSTPADACDIEDEDEKCSLHNYVVSYNLAPDASLSNGPSWSDDAFSSTQSSEILKYWREEFGWDYSSSETIDGRVGYFGFRGQPISFAPGRHDTVSIIPVSEGDNYCWVLGGNFLDICTSDDCRESYDTLGCARTTGMHFVFSLFYVNLRLNQKSGFDNFKRITDQGENTFQLDNAYSLTNQYYVERVGTSDLDPLYHTVFALPSPCMVSGSQSLFYLESYEADCGVHIKPPCPGGWCAPIISRLSDPPLRTPLQVPGSGCSLVDCSEADGMTTVGTGEGECQCAYSLTDGGWDTEGTCRELMCLPYDDSGQYYSEDFLWVDCAAPAGIPDPLRPSDRDSFDALQTSPNCGCDGIAECPQSELLSATSLCGDEAFSPHCTPLSSVSGSQQKSLWKMELCHGSEYECGPTLSLDGSAAGCTTDWVEEKCGFLSFTYNYVCSGAGNEKTTCKFLNSRNYERGVANDIRDILVQGLDFISWKRGSTTQGISNSYDPDADGVLGWTKRYFCLSTGQYVNVPSCSLNHGCSPDPVAYHPNLYDWSVSSSSAACGCCGNGVCEPHFSENCETCPYDCKFGETTDAATGETTNFCCGISHEYDSAEGECVNPLCTSNSQNVTCDVSETCNNGLDQVCYHCAGERIPLEIAFSDGDEDLLNGCESFLFTQPICLFEQNQPCEVCGAGSNSGCPSNQICNLDTCSCEADCEDVGSCADYDHDCDVGQKPCFDNVGVCEGQSCFVGPGTCCYQCEETFSGDLVNTFSNECDETFFPCCPDGQYPEPPDQCDCIDCTMDDTDDCLCDRCDDSKLFEPLSDPSFARVNIDRFNPYGCECVDCESESLECADGETVFPPQQIQVSNITKGIVTDWIAGESNTACPECTSCTDLFAAGKLFDSNWEICDVAGIDDPCKCVGCEWENLGCAVDSRWQPIPTSPAAIGVFAADREDYLYCFSIDPVCDISQNLIRDSDSDCLCATCSCPAGYAMPDTAEPCDISACVLCGGVTDCDAECGANQRCVTSGGEIAASGECNVECDLCSCENCPELDYVCETADGGTPNQYDWYIQTGGSVCGGDVVCERCLDIMDPPCPEAGLSFDTTYTDECRCAPCNDGDCECYLLIDPETFDATTGIVDYDYWADINNQYDGSGSPSNSDLNSDDLSNFVGSSCSSMLDCLFSNTDSACADVTASNPSSVPDIDQPSGVDCRIPYSGPESTDGQKKNAYTPYFMWNRMTGGTDTCGETKKLRFPSSIGTSDAGLWKVLPTTASDGFQHVPVLTGNPYCKLPPKIPNPYVIYQGSAGNRQLVDASAFTHVQWDEVSYPQWIQALFMGLIDVGCLQNVIGVTPISNVEVYDLKGQTCTALIYKNDINQDYSVVDGDVVVFSPQDLGNEKRGAFKFTVLDFELPSGTEEDIGGAGDCVYDLPDGRACQWYNNWSPVANGVDNRYLLMWIEVVCEEGYGGYVWADQVKNFGLDCGPQTCGDFPIVTDEYLDDGLTVSGVYCASEDTLTVTVNWNDNNNDCHPLVKVWVTGDDYGNDLSVPLSVDGYQMDCSSVCTPSGDFYSPTGGNCVATISIDPSDNLVGRWIMASSCGGGSQGGSGGWSISAGGCSRRRDVEDLSSADSCEPTSFSLLSDHENIGDNKENVREKLSLWNRKNVRAAVDYTISCDGVDTEDGVNRVLDHTGSTCSCDVTPLVTSCEPRCNTTFNEDRTECIPCSDSIEDCQENWETEICTNATRWETPDNEADWYMNGCSNCFPCDECTTDPNQVGSCDWVVVDNNCEYLNDNVDYCPPGTRVDPDTIIPGQCPECVPPSEACPCDPPTDNSDPNYLIVFILADVCDDVCSPYLVPKQIPDYILTYAAQSSDCNGTVEVIYDPCPDCDDPGFKLLDPNDKCSCVECGEASCPPGQRPKNGNPCLCVNCTCDDCYAAIERNNSGICIDGAQPPKCNGCTNEAGDGW
eukprot:CAMPEP_0201475122 /NCGR_PEP_ID=MMETSP0151_2-20130828/581_1 /ASSEMBLY_ACC=CAM_ASM_000257 /TAXON_ID=200890 /ORGANISM="Paramoeba atlantica, Strain 621/1 / CCAP 1560/9" /LENGTH=2127 /DNA_ID=CAMNT_0047855137 /DNA_START=505 /DNA_END=6885 /DNA_ORIENTATION=-